jgi:hypothetical protein
LWEGLRGRGIGGGLDVALFVGADRLLHLDLLLVTLSLVQLCAETAQVLGARGGGVAFASFALALALFMVEAVRALELRAMSVKGGNKPATMLLRETLHVLILRHLERDIGRGCGTNT